MPLCSVLIPSRKNLRGLTNTINELRGTGDDYEVIVRADNDDEEMRAWSPPERVRVIFGERGRGYDNANTFVMEAENQSQSPWCCQIDDDSWLVGRVWDQLKQVPLAGYIAHPQFYHLCGSHYDSCDPVAPFWPRHSWKRFQPAIHCQVDEWIKQVMCVQNGWRTWKLNGIIFKHNRQEGFCHD